MKEAMQDFEQMQEEKGTKKAIVQYYGKYWKHIAGGCLMLAILLILPQTGLSVGARFGIGVAILIALGIWGEVSG